MSAKANAKQKRVRRKAKLDRKKALVRANIAKAAKAKG